MEEKEATVLAHEAFIRRAAIINLPFMLKGSYAGKQYFPNPKDRIPRDIDWVYLERIHRVKNAKRIFSRWVTEITDKDLEDGVVFQSFTKNEFWRGIDYAMNDDFPTVNTDLTCWVNGEKINFDLDISFNLEVEFPSVSLVYTSLLGDSFIINHTVPLSLQISWKIHQTLVRPRFKDLFDLYFLIDHKEFNKKVLTQVFIALINECNRDNINLDRVEKFLYCNFEPLFNTSIDEVWDYWRHNIRPKNNNYNLNYGDQFANLSSTIHLPIELSDFIKNFQEMLIMTNLTVENFDKVRCDMKQGKQKEPKEKKSKLVDDPIDTTTFNQVQMEPSKLSISEKLMRGINKLFNE